MTEQRTRLVRKKRNRTYHGRGGVYSWLRGHYAEIERLLAGQPHLWAALALDILDDGVTDGRGKPPTADNLRVTWRVVARDAEAAAAAKAAAAARPGGVFPSRISPSWRPTVVPPQSDSRAVALAPTRYGSSSSTALSPTQPIPGSQNSAVTSTPPDFPTVDPAGNRLPDGFVWWDDEPTLLHVAQALWALHESSREIDLRWQGLKA